MGAGCTTKGSDDALCGSIRTSPERSRGEDDNNLQDLARSSLLHAQRAWPDAIHPSLWPYALRKAAHDLNNIARVDEELTASRHINNLQAPTYTPNLPIIVHSGVRSTFCNHQTKWASG
jgi:hypothetical protein